MATGQRLAEREQPGTGRKKAWPTAVILDTQSVKNAATATGATGGFDAGKLVKGRKRLVLTDTLGHVLASRVVPANAADAIAFWDEVVAVHDLLGQVQVVFVDSSFNGVFREHLAHRYGVRVEKPAHVLVKKPISASMPGGRLWNEPSRGLAQSEDCLMEYDRSLRHANAWIILANIQRLLKFC